MVKEAMVPFFPKQVANKACAVFIIVLALITLIYFEYTMSIGFIIAGIAWVFLFFLFSSYASITWLKVNDKTFIEYLFITALVLRLSWVIFSYFFYLSETGTPFEYAAADSYFYHDIATNLASSSFQEEFNFVLYAGVLKYSDVGYPIYLSLLYRLFGNSIIIPRIIKAFISAYTCILVYKISARTFEGYTSRIAGIMMALMPNLIIYCGYHLKETEMLFLEVAFLERLDFLIRSKKVFVWDALLPTIIALSLFLFRTVLGAAALFAFATTVLVSSGLYMKKNGRRAALIIWGILSLVALRGSVVMTETEALWEERDTSIDNKRIEQTRRGNQWAKYATGSVMAPMAFILPFSTLINVDEQYGQQEKAGGNFVRNFMGFFALLAIYEAIRRKKWRDFVMIGAFVFAYLGVVSLSGFSNSERFLLPGLPCLIMMWAYGISTLRERSFRLFNSWCLIVVIIEIGWAYFKLGSRGLF